jgi:hypothetical protein
LSFTALLANADAATFNLLRRGWFIPSDNIGRIVTNPAACNLGSVDQGDRNPLCVATAIG